MTPHTALAARDGVPGPVLVMGTGAIGGWVGGALAAAGAEVHFVGRPAALATLRAQGLTLTDLAGGRRALPGAGLHLHEQPPTDWPAPPLALLCVKSAATDAAAAQLGAALPAGSVVLSLQNGLHNAERAALAAPTLQVIPGMVPYNVAELAPGHLHRGSSGQLAVQQHPALAAWQPVFAAAGLAWRAHPAMRPVQWAKLLLNLNNPVNALSGLPLQAQLLDPALRACTAALMAEALGLLKQAGEPLARLTPLPPGALPGLMRLPTPLFRVLAARLLRMDPKARSSMADDLARGRPTEVPQLCGEVVALAQRLGRDAPVNARMIAMIEAAPARGRPWSGPALRAALMSTQAAAPGAEG